MSRSPSEAMQRHRHLATSLGPLVKRGPYQYFFATPMLPESPLTSEDIRQAWAALGQDIRAQRAPELINLYLHFPFCSHRCRYCIYHSTADHTPAVIERYATRLQEELAYYAEPLDSLRLAGVYLGGGTPTVLTVRQLRPVLDALGSRYGRLPGGAWTFETNPLTATPDRAALFADHGFNRVSFGVQTLDPAALAAVNRGYQTREQVDQTLDTMRKLDLWINVDLLAGLPGERTEELAATATHLLERGATELTIYALSPYTPKAAFAETAPQTHDLPQLARILEPALASHGVEITCNDTNLNVMVSTERQATTGLYKEQLDADRAHDYDDITIEPYSLLGLGPTARSYVYSKLSYRTAPFEATAPFDPDARIALGRNLSTAEEQRRFVLAQLSGTEGLTADDYEARFNEPLDATFAHALAAIRELGLVAEAQGRIHLAPVDQTERFAAALFFVDDQRLAITSQTLAPTGKPSPFRPSAPRSGDHVDLLLTSPRGELVVRLVDAAPDQASFFAAGGIAFFEPREAKPRRPAPEALRQAALRAFRGLFKRLIETTTPASAADLAETLISGKSRLRLTSRQQPGRALPVRISRFWS